jgi:hypothetical protein
MVEAALRPDGSVSYRFSCSSFDFTRNLFSAEIERNRRKVMEINYFLDNQQINFDTLTSDIVANVNFKVVKFDENSPDVVEGESGNVEQVTEGSAVENPIEDIENPIGEEVLNEKNEEH